MIDTFKHKGQRKKLVESLFKKGITDKNVLQVINNVPRHLFMQSEFEEFAYKDQAFPIACEQTISQPYTVAFQTQLLNISKGDKILEIGTGSGYQAAILLEMGAKVYSIERQRPLFLSAQIILNKFNYKIDLFYGDGYIGKQAFMPYDKILITAGAPYIPTELLKQLKIGGMLVAPVGGNNMQAMTSVTKIGKNDYNKKEHGSFVFVPLLKGTSN